MLERINLNTYSHDPNSAAKIEDLRQVLEDQQINLDYLDTTYQKVRDELEYDDDYESAKKFSRTGMRSNGLQNWLQRCLQLEQNNKQKAPLRKERLASRYIHDPRVVSD